MNTVDHLTPKRNIRNALLFNIVLWISSFILFLIVFTEDGQPKTIDFIYTTSFLVTIIIPVLINFYILIPLLLKKEFYLAYIVAFMLNIVVFTQLNIWFFNHMIDYVFPDYYFISYHSNVALLTIFAVFLVITTLIKLSVDWFYFNRNENRELKIKNQQIQTQLTNLRSQINPHFLFNSLNVIYALAIENKSVTKDAIVQLSDILRYVIYDSSTERVTLKNEIILLKNYIQFQQYRYNHTNQVKFDYETNDDNYLIYPMLLLPLVENSFKHGIKGDINNTFINIKLSQNDNEFKFYIENNYSENQIATNGYSGLGNENIKQNLELVYPKCHEFTVSRTKGVYSVTLKLFENEN